jgi:hypothetical protein
LVAIYLIWFVINLILLAVSEDKKAAGLYPFNDISDNEYIKIYNYTSFFFYLIIPIVAFIIWDLLRNKK